jgi:hypothetical protein
MEEKMEIQDEICCDKCREYKIHIVGNCSSELAETERILLSSLLRDCRKLDICELEQLGNMLSKDRGCSLRVIDTFCSTHLIQNLHLYSVYKQKVNTHGKKKFDCFAREKKISICIQGKKYITAVRQLNFMLFYVQYRIGDILKKDI